nr:immunoglobulin light chain junction region [Macaca mulatta]MOX69564.1 immunoglobulin light chain junction region [Macaca mulatta]MOX70085.1 immunoglobulin light chain junction region [Macaca mulatta]MOX70173.1 immunoglobulin light chain junction region [Macaca mulatta]MOX70703.1 immunoglobulin light chain junction region [Macaca mulatta]
DYYCLIWHNNANWLF